LLWPELKLARAKPGELGWLCLSEELYGTAFNVFFVEHHPAEKIH
jgi:hypothetical protein